MTNLTPDAPELPATQGYVYEQPAPPKPKRTDVIVLSVLAVLLLGGTTAFGVLYFKEKDHAKSVSLKLDTTKKDLTASALRENAAKADLAKEQDLRNKAEEAQKKAEAAARRTRRATKPPTTCVLRPSPRTRRRSKPSS